MIIVAPKIHNNNIIMICLILFKKLKLSLFKHMVHRVDYYNLLNE